MLCNLTWIIAESTAPTGGQSGAPAGGNPSWLIGLVLMIAVFYIVLLRGNKKQQRERQNMLSNLKKNDRVMTIGGVIGKVYSVEEHEVVLRVDESTNTKITFIRKAIQQVLPEGDLAAADREQK